MSVKDDPITARMVKMYKGGCIIKDIMRETHFSRMAVYYRLKSAGIQFGTFRRRIPEDTRRQIAEAYADGASMDLIMARCGISASTVRSIAREYGIKMRPRGGDRRSKNAGNNI